MRYTGTNEVSGTSHFCFFGHSRTYTGGAKSTLGRIYAILSTNRILSRSDLVDGLKNSKYYCATDGNFFFFIFRPKKFENGQKMTKKMKFLKKKFEIFFAQIRFRIN